MNIKEIGFVSSVTGHIPRVNWPLDPGQFYWTISHVSTGHWTQVATNIKQVKTSRFIYKPIKSLFKDNFTRPKLQQNIKHKTKEQNFALL